MEQAIQRKWFIFMWLRYFLDAGISVSAQWSPLYAGWYWTSVRCFRLWNGTEHTRPIFWEEDYGGCLLLLYMQWWYIFSRSSSAHSRNHASDRSAQAYNRKRSSFLNSVCAPPGSIVWFTTHWFSNTVSKMNNRLTNSYFRLPFYSPLGSIKVRLSRLVFQRLWVIVW